MEIKYSTVPASKSSIQKNMSTCDVQRKVNEKPIALLCNNICFLLIFRDTGLSPIHYKCVCDCFTISFKEKQGKREAMQPMQPKKMRESTQQAIETKKQIELQRKNTCAPPPVFRRPTSPPLAVIRNLLPKYTDTSRVNRKVIFN